MSNLSDGRFALKLLLKQKGFTAAALLTLALCIGANTAIFSVVNSVLLRPLPFDGADRLVTIYNSYPRAGVERGGAAAPDYFDRQALSSLQAVAMYQPRGMTIGESGRPEQLQGLEVTPTLFPLLGISAGAGRTFLDEEGEPGNEHHALLSYGLWHDRYGGSADVVGQVIRIDDVAHTIVGVMPRDFVFHSPEIRLWVPLAFPAELREDGARHSNNWAMIARLSPGSSVQQAQQQIDALNARNEERLPQFSEILRQVGFRTVVADYRSELTREVRGTLWLLQAGVLLVLLIGCVNIANLVLVRATARHPELATRAALGAAPARLVRQLVTESLLLALGGGLLGILVGWGGVTVFSSYMGEHLPRGTEVALDVDTLIVSLIIAAGAGLLFSAAPVVRLLRADLAAVVREEGRSGTAARSTTAWRSALVTAQVSLAFTLLVGAGLMMMSFSRTLSVDPGFDPTDVATASVSLPLTRYPGGAERRQFTERLLERVRAIPGVTDAAATSVLPFSDEMNASAVTPEGYEPRPDDALVAPVISRVTERYFETMGIEVLAGRSFSTADVEGSTATAMVDRFLADRFWPGQDPIGRRIMQGAPGPGDGEPDYRTIVGVVEEVRVGSLTGEDPLGHYYLPNAQVPSGRLFLTLKVAGNPASVAGPLRAAVAELDPDLPLHDFRRMDERLAQSVTAERLRMLLLSAFGALALFLAAIGLYGVLAYSVAQRKVEIGIRMALGGTAAAVFRMIVGQGARLIGAGLLVGLGVSLATGRLVRSMLYDVEPGDPVVLAGVLALLAATAVAACVLPAQRATRVDPIVAIREGR